MLKRIVLRISSQPFHTLYYLQQLFLPNLTFCRGLTLPEPFRCFFLSVLHPGFSCPLPKSSNYFIRLLSLHDHPSTWCTISLTSSPQINPIVSYLNWGCFAASPASKYKAMLPLNSFKIISPSRGRCVALCLENSFQPSEQPLKSQGKEMRN